MKGKSPMVTIIAFLCYKKLGNIKTWGKNLIKASVKCTDETFIKSGNTKLFEGGMNLWETIRYPQNRVKDWYMLQRNEGLDIRPW